MQHLTHQCCRKEPSLQCNMHVLLALDCMVAFLIDIRKLWDLIMSEHELTLPALKPLPIKTKGENFLKKLFIWLIAARKWQLVEDWPYTLSDGTKIVIPKGFEFDGASVPRFLWWLLSPVGVLFIQGLIHDYAYKYNRLELAEPTLSDFYYKEGAGRIYWDKVFLREGIAVNGIVIVDLLAFLCLVLFGGFAWRSHRKQEDSSQ